MKVYGFLAAALGVFGFSSAAGAFDTGHHSDLTRAALSEFRMSEDAIQTAQLENWLVDYYTNQPGTGLGDDLEKLHFDNLTTTNRVRNYWGRLTVNTKKAVEAAAREGNSTRVVALIGMSLHAVQDFYTHSNWVETHPGFSGAYSTRTWFDFPVPDTSTSLFTGEYPNHYPIRKTDHGTYTNLKSMNHDSYIRPRWDDAYVYAYSASVQWVSGIEKWVSAVDPSVWSKARDLSLSTKNQNALQTDLRAAYRVSEWVSDSKNDGHWKGNGSGSATAFGSFTASWAVGIDSIFVEHFKNQKWHKALTENLMVDLPPETPVPAMPSKPLYKKAIRVRTTLVEELPVGFFESKIDVGGSPDFFARVTIDGVPFIEAMQIDKSSITPSWWSIKFVDIGASDVAIRYELFDEDSSDEVCDINPASGKQTLDFSLSSGGRVSGDISGSAGKRITSEGATPDGSRARVKLVIDSRDLMQ